MKRKLRKGEERVGAGGGGGFKKIVTKSIVCTIFDIMIRQKENKLKGTI